jgi:hypothetical protein
MPDDHCGRRSPKGYLCLLAPDHSGDHIALGNTPNEGAYDRWPNAGEAAVEPEGRTGRYRCSVCTAMVEFPWKFCGQCGVKLMWAKDR